MKKKKIRLLHVISRLDVASGGPISNLKPHLNEYNKSGITAEILTTDKNTNDIKKKYNIKIHLIKNAILNYKYSHNYNYWLKKNLKNYDLVIVNGIWEYHNYAVYNNCLKLNIPYLIFIHGMLDPWFDKKYFLKKIKKKIYWKLIQSKILENSTGLVFTNKMEHNLAKRNYKFNNKKIIIHRYGSLKDKMNMMEYKKKLFSKFPELKRKKIILFLGRIHEKKGCDILIDAFEKIHLNYKDAHLVFTGPKNENIKYINKLKKIIIEKKLKNKITWTGILSNGYKKSIFCSSYVFCLPTYQENFGISLVESLSYGLPVVTTKNTNIYKILENYEVGYVGENTVTDISRNLKNVFELSKLEYVNMKKNSLKCYNENFNLKKNILSFIQSIKKIIKKHSNAKS